MPCTFRAFRSVLIGIGLIAALSSPARSQDANPSDSSRDSIIQGVRDDVRRKIRGQQTGENRSAATRTASNKAKKKRPQAAN